MSSIDSILPQARFAGTVLSGNTTASPVQSATQDAFDIRFLGKGRTTGGGGNREQLLQDGELMHMLRDGGSKRPPHTVDSAPRRYFVYLFLALIGVGASALGLAHLTGPDSGTPSKPTVITTTDAHIQTSDFLNAYAAFQGPFSEAGGTIVGDPASASGMVFQQEQDGRCTLYFVTEVHSIDSVLSFTITNGAEKSLPIGDYRYLEDGELTSRNLSTILSLCT